MKVIGFKALLLCLAAILLFTTCVEDNMDIRRDTLHFDFTGAFENGNQRHIGDVHPFWHDGKLYMFYLRTDNTFSTELLTSEDMLCFTPEPIYAIDPKPTIGSYYVLGAARYGDGFISYFGASGEVINGSYSNDLLSWRRIDPEIGLLPSMNYPAGGRDPYVFFDEDAGIWRIIHNGIYSKDTAKDFDTALALASSVSDNLADGWRNEDRELIRFDNAGQSGHEDPECPQMLKIGDTWYIFASLYARSAHGVGRLSYWKGEQGKGIDEIDWSKSYEQFIDGEDICAAQIFEKDGRYYMYGWVPQNADGGAWGGALSLVREVYALPNGELATKLPNDIAQKISGEELLKVTQATELESTQSKYNFKSYAESAIEGEYARSVLDLKLDIAKGSRAGVVISDLATKNIHFIYLDRSMSTLYITVKVGGDYRVRAKKAVKVSDWSNVQMKIIVDGDIADVFVNDTDSLCARLGNGYTLDNSSYSLFVSGSARFEELTIHRLKTLDELGE